ncbi:MAG TPA: GHMP kinase [Actinomycetota bacterium]|jgi:D-glycero-alpha-D-manno-heptose-7-phosphate kinase|nr:GHMP kinase [Actinomycetota bacterium]
MTESTVHATAPLRISFVGGGTDFPHYYERHGGAVLSATIDHCAHVRVSPRRDRQIRIRSLDLGHLVEYHLGEGPVYDGVMDLPKAVIERVGVDVGLDVDIASDAPPGSGLGGSSALVTACVGALAMLGDLALSADEVARLSYAIEREDLGISGGWQDQYAAAFGGFNLLEFSRAGVRVSPVGLEPDRLAELRSHLLLCYTGSVRTDLGLIEAQIRLYEEGREDTMVGMKQLHEMAYEMRDVVRSGEPERLGDLLRAAFESKKLMNPHIAEGTPIEPLLDVARGAGAGGGKVCGAGGGGYLLLACRPERHTAVREALEGLGGQFADFAFRTQGVEARAGGRTWRPA